MKPKQRAMLTCAVGIAAICLTAACRLAAAASSEAALTVHAAAPGPIPRPDRVVIVIEENESFARIIGNKAAPYINKLAGEGALMTRSFGVAHPSQPNYLALFSGSTHGVGNNDCRRSLTGDNLASELRRTGLSFASYAESIPSAGYTGCIYGHYARKHNPAVNWQGVNIPASSNLPFDSFPSDYSKLPTVSLVIPNLLNDMHDGEPPKAIMRGDEWLKQNLDAYATWAATHNSLLIVTWDEDSESGENHIPTIFVGPMVLAVAYTLLGAWIGERK